MAKSSRLFWWLALWAINILRAEIKVSPTGELDTIQPLPAWWIYIKE
jgi:hypothetical protein